MQRPRRRAASTQSWCLALKEVGKRTSFELLVRDHFDLAVACGEIDMTRGAKVSGSRFAYRVGELALLELAVYRYALRRVVAQGHVVRCD